MNGDACAYCKFTEGIKFDDASKLMTWNQWFVYYEGAVGTLIVIMKIRTADAYIADLDSKLIYTWLWDRCLY
jgi:hypothetical protein